MKQKHVGNAIERDANVKTLIVSNQNILPRVVVSETIPILPGIGGGIVYDITTDRPYYCDGFNWFPMSSTGPSTDVESFGFIKGINQSIVSGVATPLTNWSTALSPSYHSIPEWNLTTGVYTAISDQNVGISVGVSWAPNISNIGSRIVNIEYRQFPSLIWSGVATQTVQPNPNVSIATNQFVSMNLSLSAGDSIRITVVQNSGQNINISLGSETRVNGYSIKV